MYVCMFIYTSLRLQSCFILKKSSITFIQLPKRIIALFLFQRIHCSLISQNKKKPRERSNSNNNRIKPVEINAHQPQTKMCVNRKQNNKQRTLNIGQNKCEERRIRKLEIERKCLNLLLNVNSYCCRCWCL